MKVEPPATAGRRRRKNCGRRSSAKPRGRVRKATSDTGAKRGRTRQAHAATEAFVVAAAAAATPLRTGYGGRVKSETAEEVPLESVTAESESTIDQQADMYVSKIVPDPATTIYPEQGSVPAASCSDHAYDSCEQPRTPPPHRRRGGRAPRPTPVRRRRRVAVDGDERVVFKAQSGHWSSLLPLGTVVRRPSVKLVQLVAQAIHESPHQMLRVTHVYAALQNRYPYYRLQDKKGISSWKSSVRHALFQKWFKKLRPTSGIYEIVRPRSFFWGLNYSTRPRRWQMPRGLPRLSTDDEGEQWDDEASTLWSGLHVNTEPPSKRTTALMPSAFRLQLHHAVPPSVWDGVYFQPPTAPPCSTTTTTSLTATMASQPTAAAMVEAVLDRSQKPRQSLSGETFLQLQLREQQQEPPQQQQQLLNVLQAPLQESQEEQQQEQELLLRLQTFADVLMENTTQQGGVLQDSLNLLEAGGPNNLCDNISTDPVDMLWAYVRYLLESGDLGQDEPLAPLPPLCSPSLTSLTQTPLTTAPSTREPTPSQQPPAIPGPSEPPQEQAGRLENIVGDYGLLTADDE